MSIVLTIPVSAAELRAALDEIVDGNTYLDNLISTSLPTNGRGLITAMILRGTLDTITPSLTSEIAADLPTNMTMEITAATLQQVLNDMLAAYGITLTSTPSVLAEVGFSYSQSNVASGGSGSYTYSVIAGSLPAGTTLNSSTGLVSGTPTTAGPFGYSIQAVDNANPVLTAAQPSAGAIIPGVPVTLTLVSTPSATTKLGVAYFQSNVAAGGTTPYLYSVVSGALPLGTNLNATTGLVNGVPITTGPFSYTIGVSDAQTPTPQTASNPLSGTISSTVTHSFFLGINLSGLESQYPIVVSSAEIAYYIGLGFNIFRLPIGWSQSNPTYGTVGIQPVVNGSLDTTSTYLGAGGYAGALDALLAEAAAMGARMVLDVHTFGFGPGEFPVGSSQVTIANFANLWQQLSGRYKGNPAVFAYDLMNEWVNGFNSTTVLDANQAAINAIRGNGDTTPVWAEGTNYSGEWNWVSGQGQPYNNANLYQITDSFNSLTFSGHGYLDNNSSGTDFAYALEIAKPGLAPPGSPTSATIGATRFAPFNTWGQSFASGDINIGETGSSNDALAAGGNDNFSAWNTAQENLFAAAQAAEVPIFVWGAGPNFQPTYPAYLGPSSISNPNVRDFTSAGLQSTIMVALLKYNGYSGAQPLAYRIDLPVTIFPPAQSSPPTITGTVATFSALPGSATIGQYYQTLDTTYLWYYSASGWVNAQAPTVTPVPYGTSGVASGNFTIRYNGKITSPITITPHDFLVDGTTAAGGTFTPSTITLPPGDNAIAKFTYTPSQSATIKITATNNAGLTNPPPVGFSSIADIYSTLPLLPTPIYGMYLRYTPYIGPAVRLQRSVDNAQMDFYFNNLGNLPRAAMQAWASANLIPIVTWYDQSSSGNNLVFTGTLPKVNINNSAGYPELSCPSGTTGTFNIPFNGQTEFSIVARIDQSSSTGGGLFRADWYTGPLVFSGSAFSIYNTGWIGGTNVGPVSEVASLTLGITDGAYKNYSVSYASGVTNGFQTYVNGTLEAETTATYTINAAFGNQQTQFGYFKFGGALWVGSAYNLEFECGQALTGAQFTTIYNTDNTYYSTPLPDMLPTTPPTIVNAQANQQIFPGRFPALPFQPTSIVDSNSGSPTDSVTITLSGAAGTLAGTGLSGSGPYTIAAASPAAVTAILQALVFTTADTVGNTTTFTIAVVSSAGSSTSSNYTSTIVANYVAETPYAAPGGTFTPINFKGVNLSGGENGPTNPIYPRTWQFDYYAGKGFGLIRLPINGETIAGPTNFGLLNATQMSDIKSLVDYAYTKNMYIVIDLHNYGYVWNAAISSGVAIVPNTLTQTLFQDMWARIATKFLNYPNVIFGLMNEPSAGGVSAAQWQQCAAAAVTSIRSVGATQKITLPGIAYTGAHSWTSSGNAAAWAGYNGDSLNNFWIEMHQYLDSDSSGTHPQATQNGSTILNSNGATSWLLANGFEGFLGEFGFAPDPWLGNPSNQMNYLNTATPIVTNGITQGGNLLASMSNVPAAWPAWSYWVAGDFVTPPTNGGYAYTVDPQINSSITGYVVPIVDQPQMAVLLANLSASPVVSNPLPIGIV